MPAIKPKTAATKATKPGTAETSAQSAATKVTKPKTPATNAQSAATRSTKPRTDATNAQPAATKATNPRPDATKTAKPRPAATKTAKPRPDATKTAKPRPAATKATKPKPDDIAEAAGLVYVNDEAPGVTRERRGSGWLYRRADGTPIVDHAEKAWIDAIGIPPAWTDVWISPTPDGHILATGRDSRGRKQYRYHPRWREVRDGTKYHRMVAFGHGLPSLRRRVDRDLAKPGLPRERVLAAAVRLMDETLIRIGNEEYARQNESFGVTTLRHDHVAIEDPATVRFEFRAKSGKEQRVRLRDPILADVVQACHELPGQELFQYVGDDGRAVDVGSSDVNAYLRAIAGTIYTAKDFRTWGGSVVAAEALAELGPPRSATDAKKKILAAIDAAAERLNNTRAVCRSSYVHPRVPESYTDRTLANAFEQARARDHLSRGECATLSLVE